MTAGSVIVQISWGDTSLVLTSFISLLVAVILSFTIAARAIRSYRTTRNRGIALLALGIVLLSGIPVIVNIILSTVTTMPWWVVAMTIDLIRLAGLLIILVTIYDS
ncbi:hypothetical protein [Halococcus sp. IIIV-5B]|uniref:hypothetical protein n=1 Tax=Halococcus sp. IIIV-5B TaxID=2321230 RepID=UPI0011C4AAAF|nr:hypothetical protein [Halococcus sp. IIIV-5B]